MIEKLYEHFLAHPRVQTDTRKLQAGEIFFALKGPNFNGNLFARQALDSGSPIVVVDEDTGIDSDSVFRVEDVLTTLQDLARYHRQQFEIPFLAITGSNGKTTTKELIHSVLSTRFKTYTTKGNLNNHIGIPLTILAIRADAEIAVIEMGANHQKEIEGYCKIALPTHGLITNCGKAHLEGFGGVEGVKKGKGELFDFLRANKGTAFIMEDYDYLVEMSRGIPEIISYGTFEGQVRGKVISSAPFLEVEIEKGPQTGNIHTHLVGDYNLPNVLAAVTVGEYFGVPATDIKSAIEAYQPSNNRSQMLNVNGNRVILDAYNANPTSMKLAIENFSRQEAEDKMLFLGGMMELGEESVQEHQSIVDQLTKYPWKEVVLVGGDFSRTKHPYLFFKNSSEAGNWLREHIPEKSMLLIKGSRSMKMETVLEALTGK